MRLFGRREVPQKSAESLDAPAPAGEVPSPPDVLSEVLNTARGAVDQEFQISEFLDAKARGECLSRCLQALSEESRALIIEYYDDERGKKIERRRRLAARLGIPLNALRIRAHRIRIGLEACVRECVGRRA